METLCDICCDMKTTFIDCSQCMKKICTDCFSSLRALQCPHCRNPYHPGMDSFEEDEDETYTIYVDTQGEIENNVNHTVHHRMNRARMHYIRELKDLTRDGLEDFMVGDMSFEEMVETLRSYANNINVL